MLRLSSLRRPVKHGGQGSGGKGRGEKRKKKGGCKGRKTNPQLTNPLQVLFVEGHWPCRGKGRTGRWKKKGGGFLLYQGARRKRKKKETGDKQTRR